MTAVDATTESTPDVTQGVTGTTFTHPAFKFRISAPADDWKLKEAAVMKTTEFITVRDGTLLLLNIIACGVDRDQLIDEVEAIASMFTPIDSETPTE